MKQKKNNISITGDRIVRKEDLQEITSQWAAVLDQVSGILPKEEYEVFKQTLISVGFATTLIDESRRRHKMWYRELFESELGKKILEEKQRIALLKNQYERLLGEVKGALKMASSKFKSEDNKKALKEISRAITNEG